LYSLLFLNPSNLKSSKEKMRPESETFSTKGISSVDSLEEQDNTTKINGNISSILFIT